MSRRRNMVLLEAPAFSKPEEHFESRGHKCNYCGGNGGFHNWSAPYADEDRWTVCPVCRGSGRMDAEVTIRWRPGEKKDR